MSSEPKDKPDWETFRFPTRPVLAFEEDDEEGDPEGEQGEGSGGGFDLRPRLGQWAYHSDTMSIVNVEINKKISLLDLDQTPKIVRLLNVLDERTDYDIDSLIDALDAAALDCYGQDLGAVLADHRWGLPIAWRPMDGHGVNCVKVEEAAPNQTKHLKSRHQMG